MTFRTMLTSIVLIVALAPGAQAMDPDKSKAPDQPPVVDKYHITPDEKAACQKDATILCSMSDADEDSLIACMKVNRAKLSPVCLKTFNSGLAKRHMT